MLINGHNEQEIVNMLKLYNIISFIFGHYVLGNQESLCIKCFIKLGLKSDVVFAVTVFNFIKVNIDAL
jgi:hypothetical protein